MTMPKVPIESIEAVNQLDEIRLQMAPLKMQMAPLNKRDK
jgi:hypothetical protein